jgi:aminopeptidase
MSQQEFSELINEVCFLKEPDPIAEWQKLARNQQQYVDYLNKVDAIRITGLGTDISMSVKDRIWVNSDGKANLPDGEIFTGPVEDSVEGLISFTYPVMDRAHIMKDVVLKFENGEVVDFSAKKGEKTLETLLKIPGARRVGEIAIGTNWAHTRFVGNIQFDEKLGGTVHLAIGNGYPETGSKNKSSLHKDMIYDMKNEGRIYADDKLIYEKGKFLI